MKHMFHELNNHNENIIMPITKITRGVFTRPLCTKTILINKMSFFFFLKDVCMIFNKNMMLQRYCYTLVVFMESAD